MAALEQISMFDEPMMSDEQAVVLMRLCREAGERGGFDPTLSRRLAAGRITALREEIRLRMLPPHTD
jgi:hypothetical protein